MDFTLTEKLSIVKGLNEIIMADGKPSETELEYLYQLSLTMDFDVRFIEESMQMNIQECEVALRNMSEEKKALVVKMMMEMAVADGCIDESEKRVMGGIFQVAGLI